MEILSDFGVQPILLVAQVINFLLLLFILNKLLYKPLVKMLELRKEKIAQAMKHADEIEIRVKKLEEEQTQIIKKANQEAQKSIKDAQELAKSQADDILKKAQEQSELLLEKARIQNEQELAQMRAAIKKDMSGIAIAAAEKAVSGILTKEQKEELTKKAAKEVAS